MHFHGPIVRPQTDAYDLFVEVTVGCTYDGCKFCNFYKDYPFRTVPVSQIEEDLQEAQHEYPDAERIWVVRIGKNPLFPALRR